MRITRDYGLISSKLEHDLLASIDKSMRDDAESIRQTPSQALGCWDTRRRYD